MALDPASLKWYQCANWSDSSSHGGGIDTTATILDTASVFSYLNSGQINTATDRYKKIYFRNESSESFSGGHVYFSATSFSSYNSIYAATCGYSIQLYDATVVSTSVSIENGSSEISTPTSLVGYLLAGEKVYNSTDDTTTDAATILTVATNLITLTATYQGSTNASCALSVCPASSLSYTWCFATTPTGAGNIALTTLAQNQYNAIWLKQSILANATNYFATNSFVLAAQNTPSSGNVILNGTFETGDLTSWSTYTWHSATVFASTGAASGGSYGCVLDTEDPSGGVAREAYISQTVDLTSATMLQFVYKIQYATAASGGSWNFRAYVGEDMVLNVENMGYEPSEAWITATADVSSYDGEYAVKIYIYSNNGE